MDLSSFIRYSTSSSLSLLLILAISAFWMNSSFVLICLFFESRTEHKLSYLLFKRTIDCYWVFEL